MNLSWEKHNAPVNGAADLKRRFRRISSAGIFFQGGAAAVDTSTFIAALVHGLTGSALAVGTVAAIARYGWLFPQLFIGYLAQRHARRLPFYMIGAFGRAACLGGIAGVLALANSSPKISFITLFFILWTVYAFVSGVVAVPYNDIVARSIPSERRSRLLAARFFGGGLLALAVAAAGRQFLSLYSFHAAYAMILLLGSLLLFVSAISFVSAGEPRSPPDPASATSFGEFVRSGLDVFLGNRQFRLFVCAQWLGGVTAMALPFYILQVTASKSPGSDVAILLAAQTSGGLLANPLWGWWGDRRGKRTLLEIVAAFGAVPPAFTLVWIATGGHWTELVIPWFTAVFFLLGAIENGRTIAQLGYLMEISPDERRPAYSGYFNALAAPAALLPVAGGAVAQVTSFAAVFAAGLITAVLQFLTVRRLRIDLREQTSTSQLSWLLAKLRYRLHGIRLTDKPQDTVWYFAFGANMHDSAFRERRGMVPIEWRPGRIPGYRLRFNLDGRPLGKAAPANLFPDPNAEVWGVLYLITHANLLHLDSTEGVPGRRYRRLWVNAEDIDGRPIKAVTYIAEGNETDGNPSLRYITMLREGARAHGLPKHYLEFLDGVKHAE